MDDAGQAVEPVGGRLQRDADLPRVDGDADAPGRRLGRAHDAAGVERDLDAAVAAARQQVAAGEGRHEGVGRMGDELRRGPLLAQAPVDDHPDPVGQRGGVAEVVGDDERRQRQGAEDVLQLAAHDRARVRVERRQRLVEQQDLRVARQRARDRDALALAARQRARALAGEMADAQALEQRADVRVARAAEGDVGAHGHVREERVLLEDEAHRAALGRQVDLRGGVEPRALAERDAPAIGAPQPGDGPQDGRLARARGPDERDRLGADAQAEAELERAKGDGEVELERLHEESIL